MKKLIIDDGTPHLCLYATKTIKIGEQLLYDYGDDPSHLYWRHQVVYSYIYRYVIVMHA
jgi:hypothetical protein